MLTKEQKQKYIKGGGVKCPFCGSEDIGGRSVDVEAGVATQGVSCSECNKYWTDVYKLVDVSVDDWEDLPEVAEKMAGGSYCHKHGWIPEGSDCPC